MCAQKKILGPLSPMLIMASLLIVLICSCAVLSESQVNEIKKFSAASGQYASLPRTLSDSYGLLLRNHKLLSISRKDFGHVNKNGGIDTSAAISAWEDLEKAYVLETQMMAISKKIESATDVLQDYSGILTLLVSDDFSIALSESAHKTGKKLDKAIDKYNAHFSVDKPIDKIGGKVAKVRRGVGGIYMRQKRYAILRDTLKNADPIIDGIMKTLEDVTINVLKPVFENYEKNYIGKEFRSVANKHKRLSVTTVAFIYNELKRTKNAIILSDKVAEAAKAYRGAHKALVMNTRSRKDLDAIISEVKTLRDEVDEAKRVEKKVEN